MKLWSPDSPQKKLELLEKEKKVAAFATAVADELKRQIVNKQFTLSGDGGRQTIRVAVIENGSKKGQVLWDSQVPGVLYVREPNSERGVLCFFDKLMKTPEASVMISAIMRQKNVPQELQAEVKSKMLTDYQK